MIGSGPAGYYPAEPCRTQFGEGVRVGIVDRPAVPFGLIRSGVAPDHQSIKGVSRRYESVALSDAVRFVGNSSVGGGGLDSMLAERGVEVVTFRDWQEIERAEVAGARSGSPRETFTSVESMLAARPAH